MEVTVVRLRGNLDKRLVKIQASGDLVLLPEEVIKLLNTNVSYQFLDTAEFESGEGVLIFEPNGVTRKTKIFYVKDDNIPEVFIELKKYLYQDISSYPTTYNF